MQKGYKVTDYRGHPRSQILHQHIPSIVIGLAWSQAIYLLFDKHINPIDALKESNVPSIWWVA
ncbi:MAG: hypothetical protein J6W56_03555 [Prevotella sp.]|nr:hypothetical protein [Prevotella sp.]